MDDESLKTYRRVDLDLQDVEKRRSRIRTERLLLAKKMSVEKTKQDEGDLQGRGWRRRQVYRIITIVSSVFSPKR